MGRIKRCMVCDLGFPRIGSLTPEMRLQYHENMPHRSKCLECGIFFVSDAHVRYHLRYEHDKTCLHCHFYCDSTYSEIYETYMESSDYERGWNEKNKDVEDSEERLEKLIEELTIEHLDVGHSDFEAEKWCKLIYFPSPMMPKRNLSREVL